MSFRRLLKDSATGLYYDGKGNWVSDHAKAHHFEDSQAAVQAALRQEKKGLHLVLKFPDERMDVSSPLDRMPLLCGLEGPAKILVASFVPATSVLAVL